MPSAKNTRSVPPAKIDPSELELVRNNARLTSLTFGLALYTSEVPSEQRSAFLGYQERFLRLCPKDRLKFYATENMRQHKPVTERCFGMLPTWIKPGASTKPYFYLELKDGQIYQDAPKFKFAVAACERDSPHYKKGRANMVSMAFPYEWGSERAADFVDVVRDLCSLMPFVSGHAGFSFECSPYELELSQTFAWNMSMRHPGIDISRVPDDAHAVGHDTIKGVNWLTVIGEPLLRKLGGLAQIGSQLSPEVEIIQVPSGIILKAGPTPLPGDTNRRELLPSYRKVYRLLAPVIEIAAKRSPSFSLATDYVEKTEAWFRRLASE